MDPLETFRTAALEVVRFGDRAGVDLEPARHDFVFQNGPRWINFWRKNDLPGTGPEDEPAGTLHYAMQGPAGHETGTLESVEQAFGLAKAWVCEDADAGQLPPRQVRRWSTG